MATTFFDEIKTVSICGVFLDDFDSRKKTQQKQALKKLCTISQKEKETQLPSWFKQSYREQHWHTLLVFRAFLIALSCKLFFLSGSMARWSHVFHHWNVSRNTVRNSFILIKIFLVCFCFSFLYHSLIQWLSYYKFKLEEFSIYFSHTRQHE